MARLLLIYARDVLAFLRYGTLQECSLVSHALANLIAASNLSARRRLGLLRISVGGLSDLCPFLPTISEDGYVKASIPYTKIWKELQEEWGCCRQEFEAETLSLVGNRICPSHPADCFVELRVDVKSTMDTLNRNLHSITLIARNELTAETAFGVLHLIDHLRDVALERHWVWVWSGDNILLLNPYLIRLLCLHERGCKLRVVTYKCIRLSHVPPTSDLLKASISHVNIGELEWLFTNISEVSNFALTGRTYCKRLRLLQPANSDFDSILEHFQSTLPAFGRDVVSELALSRIDWMKRVPVDGFWPTRLPPKDKMEELGYDRARGGNLYCHRGFANTNCGEALDVVVLCLGLTQTLAEMRLIFRV